MKQFVFEFPVKDSLPKDSFIVSEANYQAYKFITDWPKNWGIHPFNNIIYLYGSEKSGKSYLANVWKSQAEAIKWEFNSNIDYLLEQKAIIIDDLIISEQNYQELLNIINISKENGIFVLLVSNIAPQEQNIILPDLKSRILSLQNVKINNPDDSLVKMLLVKLFADYQLSIEPSNLTYILNRIDRDYSKIFAFVEKLNKQIFQYKRKITIPFLKDLL